MWNIEAILMKLAEESPKVAAEMLAQQRREQFNLALEVEVPPTSDPDAVREHPGRANRTQDLIDRLTPLAAKSQV